VAETHYITTSAQVIDISVDFEFLDSLGSISFDDDMADPS